jgi:hypothetical protein
MPTDWEDLFTSALAGSAVAEPSPGEDWRERTYRMFVRAADLADEGMQLIEWRRTALRGGRSGQWQPKPSAAPPLSYSQTTKKEP